MKSWKTSFISLLRRIEPFTHTDNVYLVKNIFHVLTMSGVNLLNGFILYILIAHFLPKEIYGQYKYLVSLFGFFYLTTVSGLDVALTRSIASGHESSFTVAFRYRLKLSLLGSLISIGIALYYFFQNNLLLAEALLALAVAAPWIYTFNLYYAFWSGKKRFGVLSKITNTLTITSFLFLACAFFFLRNPLFLFFAFLAVSTLNGFAYLYTIRHMKQSAPDPQLIPLAKHLSVLDILGIVANRIDALLVFHFLGVVPLAIYSMAIIPGEQLKSILKSIQGIAFPKLVDKPLPVIMRSFRIKLLLLCGVSLAIITIYICLAPVFFQIFFPKYQSSVLYSQVYSLSMVFGIPAAFLLTLFQAKGLKKEITLFNVINYSIQIVLLILGSWLYGLWGTILARVLTRFCMLVSSWILLLRHTRKTT